jgi:two-component sensor histidine kinase
MKNDLYSIEKKMRIIFIVVLTIIVFTSSYFTYHLVKKLSQEEKNRMEILAEATRYLIEEAKAGEDISFVMKIIEMNTTIPVIVIDESDNLVGYRNIKAKGNEDEFFKNKIQSLKGKNPPIEIDFASGEKQYFYYDDSLLLTQLSYFPLVQMLIIVVFCIIVLYALLSTKKAEQNQVWVGLSRETAHQLGTPISSLLAWVEILKNENIDPKLMNEMSKDVNRLKIIAERFSKIGSKPDFEKQNLHTVLNSAVDYMRNRVSQKVKISCHVHAEIYLPLNAPLFEWVIENLCKNAIDAMEGDGNIDINAWQENKEVIIDIKDTGKGIPKSKFKTIFNPGFTTKKRGWGLGLSLVKRIIEEYHGGKITVKNSEINKGTTFRIILPL